MIVYVCVCIIMCAIGRVEHVILCVQFPTNKTVERKHQQLIVNEYSE